MLVPQVVVWCSSQVLAWVAAGEPHTLQLQFGGVSLALHSAGVVRGLQWCGDSSTCAALHGVARWPVCEFAFVPL